MNLIVQFCGHVPACCYFTSVAFYDIDSSYYILKKHLMFVDTCLVFPSDSLVVLVSFYNVHPASCRPTVFCIRSLLFSLFGMESEHYFLLVALFFYLWHELKILSAFILIPASASVNPLCSRPTHKLFNLEYSLSPLMPNTFIFTWVLVRESAHLESVSIVLLDFFGLSDTHTFTIALFL